MAKAFVKHQMSIIEIYSGILEFSGYSVVIVNSSNGNDDDDDDENKKKTGPPSQDINLTIQPTNR
ncbi:hypothetical protein DERF_004356 [Dermatophagoides farinae]|uniref:Uncharacterized protein n=1 Tax=Dermatophagoides farinae TaxID=6954 RepID=A0A922L528_DERFA|nr:hypothetical protein DERF_004356 [Dermatophagoides farinae]